MAKFMKFHQLKVDQQFRRPGDRRVFTKVKYKAATCCTPEHNAFSDKFSKSNVVFIDDDEDVVDIESDSEPEQSKSKRSRTRIVRHGRTPSKRKRRGPSREEWTELEKIKRENERLKRLDGR